MKTLDKILDYRVLLVLSVLLGLAPFFPKPHLLEKLQMLAAGTLRRPVDIFDMFFHGWPVLLLSVRVFRDVLMKIRRET